jgi:hypothetical protein
VVGVFAVVAFLFALIGGLLLVQGTLGVLGVAGAGVGAGVFEMVVAALPFYGAYLFGRVALRVRRQQNQRPATAVEKGKRRHKVRGLLAFMVVNVVSVLGLPLPGVVKGVVLMTNLVAVPLVLARDFEPPKRP